MRAKGRNRSVADELAVVVEDALSAAEVAQLRHLDDDHLCRAAVVQNDLERVQAEENWLVELVAGRERQ